MKLGGRQMQRAIWSSDLGIWKYCWAPPSSPELCQSLVEISGDFVFVATALVKAQFFLSFFSDISCSNMDLVPLLSSVQPVRTTLWRPIPCTHPLPGHFLEAPSPDLPLLLTNPTGAAIGSARPWAPLQSPWLWPCY